MMSSAGARARNPMETDHNPGSGLSQSSITHKDGGSSADHGGFNREEDEQRLQAQREMQMVSGIATSASHGPSFRSPVTLF